MQLQQLLEDLVYQFASLSGDDAKQIEVLLVDNHSTDNTKEVAYEFTESTAMTCRYYYEAKPGLAAARNFGIKQANGDLICFIDDDVALDDNWLNEVFKIASTCKASEIGVYGGRVIPLWQERTPKWLGTDPPFGVHQEVFSGHNYGDQEQFYPFDEETRAVNHPNGTMMMFRREIFDNCGDFRTDLGVNSSGGVGLHDDLELLDYLTALNIPMLYVPQCAVFHPIAPEDMSKYAIRSWYRKSGRSLYWMWHTDRMRREPSPFICLREELRPWFPEFCHKLKFNGVPLYLYIKAAYLFLGWLLMHLTFDEKKIFWVGLRFSKVVGHIEGAKLLGKFMSKRKFSFRDRIIEKPYSQLRDHFTENPELEEAASKN